MARILGMSDRQGESEIVAVIVAAIEEHARSDVERLLAPHSARSDGTRGMLLREALQPGDGLV